MTKGWWRRSRKEKKQEKKERKHSEKGVELEKKQMRKINE